MQVYPTRTKATSAQLTALYEHMQAHPVMSEWRTATGITLQDRLDVENYWKSLSVKLNSMGGPMKTVAKWKQTWRDMRNNVKKKALNGAYERPGNVPWASLTRLGGGEADIPTQGISLDPLADQSQDEPAYSDMLDTIIELKYEEDETEETQESQDRPLSPVMNLELASPSPDDERPPSKSPAPSLTGQAPSNSSHRATADNIRKLPDHQQRRIMRARKRPTIEPQSRRNALRESLRIKEMLAEAALKNAESLRLIAETIDQCAQVVMNYFQRQNNL